MCTFSGSFYPVSNKYRVATKTAGGGGNATTIGGNTTTGGAGGNQTGGSVGGTTGGQGGGEQEGGAVITINRIYYSNVKTFVDRQEISLKLYGTYWTILGEYWLIPSECQGKPKL